MFIVSLIFIVGNWAVEHIKHFCYVLVPPESTHVMAHTVGIGLHSSITCHAPTYDDDFVLSLDPVRSRAAGT